MSPVKNTCDCPSPPGGLAVCESDQLAICRVVNGIAETECIDPPAALTGNRLRNWFLERITQQTRRLDASITTADASILRSGQYSDRVRGMHVTFALPRVEGEAVASAVS